MPKFYLASACIFYYAIDFPQWIRFCYCSACVFYQSTIFISNSSLWQLYGSFILVGRFSVFDPHILWHKTYARGKLLPRRTPSNEYFSLKKWGVLSTQGFSGMHKLHRLRGIKYVLITCSITFQQFFFSISLSFTLSTLFILR